MLLTLRVPDLDQYRSHLLKGLGFLANSRQVRKIDGLQIAIRSSLRELESGSSRDWKLSTGIPWMFPLNWSDIHPPATARLAVGVNIAIRKGSIDQHVVVFLVITEGGTVPVPDTDSCCRRTCPETPRVIRRVHFDLDTAKSGSERPRAHLQFGGQIDPFVAAAGYHYCMDSYLDYPRIACQPMDPFLLLEFLLRQFRPPFADTLTDEPMWHGIIRKSEEMWLRRHFSDSARFLEMDGRGQTFYQMLCQLS